ncbi:MAG: YdeI/OmpD-associated family protein [Candidatus Limnocylindrales bacterium]
MRFRTTIELGGTTATGFAVPPEIVAELGSGKRPQVRVTIRGYTYRSTVAVYGGRSVIGVSAEVRKRAHVAAGDEVDVDLGLDTEPREVHVPPDFAATLDPHPEARRFFDGLSYSDRRWYVLGVEEAKTPETRQRLIEKAVERLLAGRGSR